MRLSLSEFLSDLTADATAISLDMPGGGYDRLHAHLQRGGNLPTTIAGRTALVAAMLVASRLVKQQLGPLGPIANFVNEVAEDGVREEAKRLLETPDYSIVTTVRPHICSPEKHTQQGIVDRFATELFPWLKEN